jgi:cytosine/adenosine deaminase-related metal-dependent hydrolase
MNSVIQFLGEDARIGSIAVGKQADLMIVKGNPAADVVDNENVEIVFKDGVGYNSEKLIQSVQGLVEFAREQSAQSIRSLASET